jgi:hypothetical protein
MSEYQCILLPQPNLTYIVDRHVRLVLGVHLEWKFYLSGPNMFIERTLKASVVMVIPFLFALLAGLVLLGITVARE